MRWKSRSARKLSSLDDVAVIEPAEVGLRHQLGVVREPPRAELLARKRVPQVRPLGEERPVDVLEAAPVVVRQRKSVPLDQAVQHLLQVLLEQRLVATASA